MLLLRRGGSRGRSLHPVPPLAFPRHHSVLKGLPLTSLLGPLLLPLRGLLLQQLRGLSHLPIPLPLLLVLGRLGRLGGRAASLLLCLRLLLLCLRLLLRLLLLLEPLRQLLLRQLLRLLPLVG